MTKKKPAVVKKPRGRQSLYTEAIGKRICDRIAMGEPMTHICRDKDMPTDRTVRAWQEVRPAFASAIARAREVGFDAIAAGCLEIADDARNDFMKKLGEDGEPAGEKFDSEHVQRSKLRIDTRLKLLAKWDPKRYGDKLAIGGADDLPPIKTMTDEQLAARIAALQGKINAV